MADDNRIQAIEEFLASRFVDFKPGEPESEAMVEPEPAGEGGEVHEGP